MSVAEQSNFLQAFTDRHRCFSELLRFSQQQRALIDSDDYTQLLAILGSKQRVIGRLEEIGRMHPALGQDWKQQRDSLPAADRSLCDEQLAATEVLLEELMELERTSTDQLARRRDETQLELHRVTTGAQAQAAYRDSLAPRTHRHLDVGQ